MDHTVWSLTYWQLRMDHRPRFQLKIRICKTYFRISRNAVQSFFYFEDDFCLVIKSIILTICIWTFVTFNWNTKIMFINWQVTSCGRMNLDAVSILQSPTLWVYVVQDVKKSYSGLPGPWRVVRAKVPIKTSYTFESGGLASINDLTLCHNLYWSDKLQ